jgi:hypothetical protein
MLLLEGEPNRLATGISGQKLPQFFPNNCKLPEELPEKVPES